MEIKIVSFSDTHNRHDEIVLPPCDIAIFAGDYSFLGTEKETRSFLEWYDNQTQCTFKIWIAGNHDRGLDPKFDSVTKANYWREEVLHDYPNLIYLENFSVELLGLKIWGSPITPDFIPEKWAFNKPRGEEINKIWGTIPKDTDIIVTHGPARYKLDYIPQDSFSAGDTGLKNIIQEIKPKIHIFGHIHQDTGIETEKIIYDGNTVYINASIVDNKYKKIANPILTKIY